MTVLLIAAALLTTSRLNNSAFSHDELRSVIVVGGAQYGPLTWPVGVWQRVYDESPEQALGFPLMMWGWGRLGGWSEVATRTFVYLCGMLTIAVTYRAGRDLFNPPVGVVAALVLATSVVYLALMVKFRVFTLASLAVAVTMRQYIRLVFYPQQTTRSTQLWFFAGLVGLMLTHYFVTPFAAVIGVYHLVWGRRLAPRSGVLMLIALASLAMLPQLPILLRGLTESQQNVMLNAAALPPLGLIGMLVQSFSNGAPLLLTVLLGAAAWAGVQPPTYMTPSHRKGYRVGLMWWCFVAMLFSIIALNWIAEVVTEDRVRYLTALWVPLAILVGIGIWKLLSWVVMRS